MSEPIPQFAEGQGPELTQAQAMIDFAFSYDVPADEDEKAKATENLLLTLADIQAAASNEKWNKRRLEEIGHTYTTRTAELEDGSVLGIGISVTDSTASSMQHEMFGDAFIVVSAALPHSEEVTELNAHKISSVTYRLGHDEAVIVAHPQSGQGFRHLKNIEEYERAEDAGFDLDTDDERIAKAIAAETVLLMTGQDPGSDPEVESLREENEGYRHFSDMMRRQRVEQEFESQFSTAHEVGMAEVEALCNLMKTI